MTTLGPYAALEHEFAVEVEETMAHDVAALLTALETEGVRATPTSYRVAPTERGDLYRVTRDEVQVGLVDDARTAVDLLLWAVDDAAVRESDRFLLVHAAAAVRRGHVVVMPGASGSGKSTLVSALVASGWDYVTDEITAIDTSSGRVVAYPRPAKVEMPAAALLELHSSNVDSPQQTCRVPFAAGTPDAIALVVAPSVRPDSHVALTPMRAAEVVSTLAASTWNLQRHHQVGLDLLATIARRPGYRLEFGDPRAAAVVVGDALDRLTERSPVG